MKKYGILVGLLFCLNLKGCNSNLDNRSGFVLDESAPNGYEYSINRIHKETDEVTEILPLEYPQRHPSIEDLIKEKGLEYYAPGSFQRWTESLVDAYTGTAICSQNNNGQSYRSVLIRLDGSFAGGVNSNLLLVSDRESRQPRQLNEREWERIDVRTRNGHNYVIPFNQGDVGYPFEFGCNGDTLRSGVENYLREDIRGEYGEYGEYNVDFYEASWGVFYENGFRERGILPEETFYIVNGMANTESHFQTDVVSSKGAQGILQQTSPTLRNCQIPPNMYKNRLAQIDCAYRYFEDRFNRYKPLINDINISSEQENEFLLYLAVQAYHTGEGNIEKILNNLESIEIANRFVEEGRDLIEIVHGLTILNYGLGENGTKVGLVSGSYLPKVIASVRILEEVREQRRQEGNRIKEYKLPPSPFSKYRR